MIQGLVFDVDDTLYDEIDYVRSGFAHVASIAGGPDVSASMLNTWLLDAFERGVRGDTFAGLLRAFPSVAERVSESALVAAYRAHSPDLPVAPDVCRTLDRLHAGGVLLGVLSDGPPESQQAKVDALGLGRWFDPIVLTGALGPDFEKPNAAGFEMIGRAWALSGSTLAYVADNPAKDFAGPRSLGWTTIRLRHERQLRHDLEPVNRAFEPDLEIESLGHLMDLPDLQPATTMHRAVER